MTQQVGSQSETQTLSTPAPQGSQPQGARTEWVRGEWIDATHFHDLTEDEVLREVARRVSDVRAKAEGQHRRAHPLVLLDLDSTLYEVGPRTHQILREWMATEEAQAFPQVCRAIEKLHKSQVGYSLKDTFEAMGLDLTQSEVAHAERLAKKFWAARFFRSEYLQYDHAYEGAARFAQELHRLGAEIVYLTGRDEPGMGDGTRARLKQDGFPWAIDRTHLLMKAAPELDDLEHKLAAGTYVREHGTLVASFENEPPNLVALYDQFPEAMHVFVDTVCSDRPALAGRDLYRIRGFGLHA
jgi:hypothetical protein